MLWILDPRSCLLNQHVGSLRLCGLRASAETFAWSCCGCSTPGFKVAAYTTAAASKSEFKSCCKVGLRHLKRVVQSVSVLRCTKHVRLAEIHLFLWDTKVFTDSGVLQVLVSPSAPHMKVMFTRSVSS